MNCIFVPVGALIQSPEAAAVLFAVKIVSTEAKQIGAEDCKQDIPSDRHAQHVTWLPATSKGTFQSSGFGQQQQVLNTKITALHRKIS